MTPRIPRNVSHQLRQRTADNLVGTCHKCLKPIWAWDVHLRDDKYQTVEHLGCADKKDREQVTNFLKLMRDAQIGEAAYRKHLKETGRLLGPDGNPIAQEKDNN